jgi:hypothetical protein
LPGTIKIKEEEKMEKKLTQKESRKEVNSFEILSQQDLGFIRGGDGDPPPVENGEDEG